MFLFRKLSVIFTFFCAVVPHEIKAELNLEKWKTYGQMAEQSAICASFSKLMEAQSVLNPDLGALWQERRKFAGAVIRKAVFLELNRDSSEDEINNLITSYRDWLLSSLLIDYNQNPNKSKNVPEKTKTGGQTIRELMNTHCKSLFQQGDEMIRAQRPHLAYLLENDSGSQSQLKNSIIPKTPVLIKEPQGGTSVKTPVKEAGQTVDPKSTFAAKGVELSIGGGTSFTLNLPGQKPANSDDQLKGPASNDTGMQTISKNSVSPTKLKEISSPAPRPEQGWIKKHRPLNDIKSFVSTDRATSASPFALIPLKPEIQTQQDRQSEITSTGLHEKSQTIKVKLSVERLSELLDRQAEANINLTIPGQTTEEPYTKKIGNYFAQLGAFAQLKNAKAEKQRLEIKFSALFAKLPLHIAKVTDSGPRFYRIQTSGLSQKNIMALCDMMWPHKIACLPKHQNSH